MANIEVLNNVTHKNLRVVTHQSKVLGDDVGSALTFPTEYGSVMLEYPIFFRKDPDTGEFCSILLLGLREDENLFLDNQRWKGNYIPLAFARGPFVISYQDQRPIGKSKQEPIISIDTSSPKISELEGESLFDSDGQATQFTQKINRYLLAIHKGIEFSKAMFESFNRFGLIEPVNLDIQLDSGQAIKIPGNYTIHEDRLLNLKGDALEELNKNGYLQAAYSVVASLGNMRKLIEMKNQRIFLRQE
ncbi:SapC family protein [Aliikangiella marina]|uniref:SapC family protein n=1 Tax=Aliikangiella marina TaxID=1712262 RepID=A0A545T1B1_9GAMM|nr:SapC family protein [Aliikangiella marina]TQV70979.1 SapC family protein [Aliikangiella marina]